jgi:hypothetical protein
MRIGEALPTHQTLNATLQELLSCMKEFPARMVSEQMLLKNWMATSRMSERTK